MNARSSSYRSLRFVMSSIVVRSFQPEDLPACEEIFGAAHSDYGNPMIFVRHVLHSDMADIQKYYLDIPGGHWWVAVSAGDDDHQQVLGHIAVLPLKIADRSYYEEVAVEERDQICELRRMAVGAKAQRRGVGVKLLATLTDFARDNGYRQIHLTTLRNMDKACAFYEKNGFVKGRIERFSTDQMNVESEEDLKKLFSHPPNPVIFKLGSVLPDEDLQRMNRPPQESGFIYVQHYSRMI